MGCRGYRCFKNLKVLLRSVAWWKLVPVPPHLPCQGCRRRARDTGTLAPAAGDGGSRSPWGWMGRTCGGGGGEGGFGAGSGVRGGGGALFSCRTRRGGCKERARGGLQPSLPAAAPPLTSLPLSVCFGDLGIH